MAEVIGFHDDLTLLAPWGDMQGVRHGSSVRFMRQAGTGCVWASIIRAHQRARRAARRSSAAAAARPSAGRRLCRESCLAATHRRTAVDRHSRIDGMLTCGKGRRMGIFAARASAKACSWA